MREVKSVGLREGMSLRIGGKRRRGEKEGVRGGLVLESKATLSDRANELLEGDAWVLEKGRILELEGGKEEERRRRRRETNRIEESDEATHDFHALLCFGLGETNGEKRAEDEDEGRVEEATRGHTGTKMRMRMRIGMDERRKEGDLSLKILPRSPALRASRMALTVSFSGSFRA